MSKFQISWPGFTCPGRRVTLERPGTLNATGLLYICVIGLTGCATSAELDSLRAEVARANAIAARAEANVSRTQDQLAAALKASSEPPEVISSPPALPASIPTATVTSGYKWGKLHQN